MSALHLLNASKCNLLRKMGLVGCKLFFSVIDWHEASPFLNLFLEYLEFFCCKTVILISIVNLMPLANCSLKIYLHTKKL